MRRAAVLESPEFKHFVEEMRRLYPLVYGTYSVGLGPVEPLDVAALMGHQGQKTTDFYLELARGQS